MLSGYLSGIETGFIDTGALPGLLEASGLAASRIHADVFYTHSDEPDVTNNNYVDVVAIDISANLVSRITLQTPGFDIEDIAAWHDGTDSWLIVADTGDNAVRDIEAGETPEDPTRAAASEPYRLYIFKEPASLASATQTITSANIQVLQLTLDYANDIETLMVDTNGDIYLISKHGTNGNDFGDHARIYQIPRSDWDNGETSATANAIELSSEERLIDMHFITAGDISPTGGEILLRNRREVWLFERAPGQTIVQALVGANPLVGAYTRLPYEMEAQGEAIVFDRSGRGFYTLSEAGKDLDPQALIYYDRGEMYTASYKEDYAIVIDSALTQTTYAGTLDTYINDDNDEDDLSHADFPEIHADAAGDVRHALLKFDNIFGTGATQLDLTTPAITILGAEVRLYTDNNQDGNGGSLRRMISDWNEAVTWNGNFGMNGIRVQDNEISATSDASIGSHDNQLNAFRGGVADSLVAWGTGTQAYRGWGILPGGGSAWQIKSSDQANANEFVRQPELVVNYYKQRDTTLTFADEDGWTYTHLDDNPSDDGQGDHWYELDFDDSGWTAGGGKFAEDLSPTEEVDTAMSSNNTEYFFRQEFGATAGQVAALDSLRLAVRTIGKVSIYFNGDAICTECGAATFDNEFQFIEIPFTSTALVEGDNVIAVKVERSADNTPLLFQLQASGHKAADLNGDNLVNHTDIGDFNDDEAVDADDVDLLRDAIYAAAHTGGVNLAYDLNGDGVISGSDHEVLIEDILDTRPGDVNLDGMVNIADLATLATWFGTAGGWAKGDVDTSLFDSTVNITDLSTLASWFGYDNGQSMMMSGFGEGVIELSDDGGEDVGDGLVKYIISVETTSEDAIIALDLRITADDTGTLNQQNPDVCCGPLETLFQDNNWAFPYDEETDFDHDSQWLWNSSNLMIVWEDYESNALTYESTTVLSGVFAVSSANAFYSRAIAQIVLPTGYTATITGRVALVGGYEEEVYWVIGEES